MICLPAHREGVTRASRLLALAEPIARVALSPLHQRRRSPSHPPHAHPPPSPPTHHTFPSTHIATHTIHPDTRGRSYTALFGPGRELEDYADDLLLGHARRPRASQSTSQGSSRHASKAASPVRGGPAKRSRRSRSSSRDRGRRSRSPSRDRRGKRGRRSRSPSRDRRKRARSSSSSSRSSSSRSSSRSSRCASSPSRLPSTRTAPPLPLTPPSHPLAS